MNMNIDLSQFGSAESLANLERCVNTIISPTSSSSSSNFNHEMNIDLSQFGTAESFANLERCVMTPLEIIQARDLEIASREFD